MNDYRNPIVAEAMKVLGFVNRFIRGVLREEELLENGNGEPEFNPEPGTAFMVIENASSSANEGVNETQDNHAQQLQDTHKARGANAFSASQWPSLSLPTAR